MSLLLSMRRWVVPEDPAAQRLASKALLAMEEAVEVALMAVEYAAVAGRLQSRVARFGAIP
jgi:hypothetical protein